ncbi:putative GTP-ase activating protein [Ancylostoma ceylanicum]|nr:putative GTP-ase activating protein [Ancylostoma ceylanicum]EYC18307.1 hypothetical protein Y032_0028g1790 [Ancylostoma ceylanicum]
MLREEENKHCADCLAKQPRWASWNIGVFICIKCAGIHRNMGVHISKVKSVNLDSWTAEQVQSMRLMGNAKAKQVYESELPNHFRRPTTDQALESFIRGKYEHKRYILPDWTPPKVNADDLPLHPAKPIEIAPKIAPPTLTQRKNEVRPPMLSPQHSQLLDLGGADSSETCSPKLLDLSNSEGNDATDGAAEEDNDEFGDFFGSATTSNSSNNNTVTGAISEDLAGLDLGPTTQVDEVKSTSEILALYKNAVKQPGWGEFNLGYNVHDPKSWANVTARQTELLHQSLPCNSFNTSALFAMANPFSTQNAATQNSAQFFDTSFLAMNTTPALANQSATISQPLENKSPLNDLDVMQMSDSFL